jgi:hypothetical protein
LQELFTIIASSSFPLAGDDVIFFASASKRTHKRIVHTKWLSLHQRWVCSSACLHHTSSLLISPLLLLELQELILLLLPLQPVQDLFLLRRRTLLLRLCFRLRLLLFLGLLLLLLLVLLVLLVLLHVLLLPPLLLCLPLLRLPLLLPLL